MLQVTHKYSGIKRIASLFFTSEKARDACLRYFFFCFFLGNKCATWCTRIIGCVIAAASIELFLYGCSWVLKGKTLMMVYIRRPKLAVWQHIRYFLNVNINATGLGSIQCGQNNLLLRVKKERRDPRGKSCPFLPSKKLCKSQHRLNNRGAR